MASPPISQAPSATVPALQSPDQLYGFLSEICESLLLGRVESDPKRRMESFFNISQALVDNFLASFPSPNDMLPWSTLQETRRITTISMRLIQQISGRTEDSQIFSGPGLLGRNVFFRFFSLSSLFDSWVDLQVPPEEGYDSPEELQAKARQTCIAVLRALGNSGKLGPDSETIAGWGELRTILDGCLSLCEELLLYPQQGFPIYVSPFEMPRIQPRAAEQHSKQFVELGFGSQVPLMVASTLDIVMGAINPHLLSQCYLIDVTTRTFNVVGRTFDYIFSPLCATTGKKRVDAIARLLSAIARFYPLPENFIPSWYGMRHSLVMRRLQDGPDPSWDQVDRKLCELCRDLIPSCIPIVHVASVVESIRACILEPNAGNLRDLGIKYLRMFTPYLDKGDLELILSIQDTEERIPLQDLLHAVNTRLHDLGGQAVIAVRTFALNGESDWRIHLLEVVQTLVAPDEVKWMEDEGTLADSQYISRALDDVEGRFKRPLSDSTSVARVRLTKELANLPCVIFHNSSSTCEHPIRKPAVSTIPVCLRVGSCLLDGTENEVTAEVRRLVYEALRRSIRHHTTGFGGRRVNHASEFISRGLKDQDRSVRLSAGRSLAELIRLYQDVGNGALARTQPLFESVLRAADNPDNRMKETALITAGYVGKVANPEVLYHPISFLVSLLGNPVPTIRATSFLQLVGLAKHHKLGTYPFMAPYLGRIAPKLVIHASSQPLVLTEACRFMAVSTSQFISLTQTTTLPRLFAACDLRTLQLVSSEIGIPLPTLFMKHGAPILAYIFCQPTGHTNMTSFVISTLAATPGSESIDLASIVRSYLVDLLAEIISVTGEEAEGTHDKAVRALLRVEHIMNTSKNSRSSSENGVEAILRPRMLGIITALHDLLQDMHGKKSIETKRTILRSLGHFVTLVGPTISTVAPQLMATMQAMLPVPEFAEATLQSWFIFLKTLEPKDLGPLVAATSASFVTHWSTFSHHARDIAKQCLEYVVMERGGSLKQHLGEVADLGAIPQLTEINAHLKAQRPSVSLVKKVEELLERASNNNITVALQALSELKNLMLISADNMNALAFGDVFNPLVSRILSTLLGAAHRVEDNAEPLHDLAFDCIGILGAVDPDRLDLGSRDTKLIMLSNFVDEEESASFALHLVTNILFGAFQSTSDITYQRHLAYAIQELLRFCKFNSSLVTPASGGSLPLKVRTRWANLPRHVQEVVTPLLEVRYETQAVPLGAMQHPIYPTQSTYREWIQRWTGYLISRVTTKSAKDIFAAFTLVVRNKDVGIAHYLLPHLALNVLVSGSNEDSAGIRDELLAVLHDQVDIDNGSTQDKKDLSAQIVFMLMDHLNEWVRLTRQSLNAAKTENKRSRSSRFGEAEEQLVKVDSILSSIDQNIMAKAALKCKAYARALMCYEQQIIEFRGNKTAKEVHEHYERLHEIYSQLDEPDGMEGVSTLILEPSLEHQIRQHESTGRWTSAQSCWEVRLQHSPDDLKSHLGLLECLRNLGHYDTMRTHVKGVLIRNPNWHAELVGYEVESEWIIGNWDEVQSLVKKADNPSPPLIIAQVLLAMRSGQEDTITEVLMEARRSLGGPVTAAGPKGYRRCYESVVNLHLVHEVEMIHRLTQPQMTGQQLDSLLRRLSSRLDFTLPAYRIREPILSLRRTVFGQRAANVKSYREIVGESWLQSAKLARKAGYWQTAYSATLQAQQSKHPFAFIQSSKLAKSIGEPLRALQELESSMQLSDMNNAQDVIDLTDDEEESKKMKAKAKALRARWMNDSDRFDVSQVLKAYQEASDLWTGWESGQFHLGRFHDDCFKSLSHTDQLQRGTKMNLQTVRCFIKAIRYGSKYIYQTVPRLLTLWLDMGEHTSSSQSEVFAKVNAEVSKAIKVVPVFKWYTAFPQIVSRVGHTNKEVYVVLSKLISNVIQEFPKQSLWLFASVVKSTKSTRSDRGRHILDKLKTSQNKTEVPGLISACLSMIEELLNLCNSNIRDDRRVLTMSKDFPRLYRLMPSKLIIPLQESLTASLPPTSTSESTHQPFPVDAPTFYAFHEEIEIMKSLAKPRKITIQGSDGKVYMFLGKPKDDLRKDARLMDFNAIINKLLKSNSESRRRHLYIRTYGVVTLNEECGFIQWVPNTIPLRPVFLKYYDARGIRGWSSDMGHTFGIIKEISDKEAAKVFKSDILSIFPPVFHEWFLETFPEPSAWLASRLSFSRTAAVMSMVGFILGLGDRHCENILLDLNNGDAVHVDFNCLFEKGKTLETPERVPFRLTQNLVDGLGVTGVEGVFRIACEITMQLLRDNKDTLMSVLDAFVHDPLVEWEDEKRKLEREAQRRNTVRDSVDLRHLAKNALYPIQKKLKGIYSMGKEKSEKEISTSSLVQILIQEATDEANLAKMYPGWAPWH